MSLRLTIVRPRSQPYRTGHRNVWLVHSIEVYDLIVIYLHPPHTIPNKLAIKLARTQLGRQARRWGSLGRPGRPSPVLSSQQTGCQRLGPHGAAGTHRRLPMTAAAPALGRLRGAA
jgi:hypothetical protein